MAATAPGLWIPQASAAVNPAVTASVDYSARLRSLQSAAVSSCISTYGANTVVSSQTRRDQLKGLQLGRYRLPIQWNGGNPISSASGGPTNVPAMAWVDAIRALGASPVVVIGGRNTSGAQQQGDMNFTSSDAAAMVRYFGAKVRHYVIGNEPGNTGMSADAYCDLFLRVVPAMKAVDPAITVAGPGWSYFDKTSLSTFIRRCGTTTDVVDFHHYGQGATRLDDATSLRNTQTWADEITWVQQQMSAAGAPGKPVQIGECHFSWNMDDERLYKAITTVWAASVIGKILTAGGWAFQYSDQNGALGLSADPGNPYGFAGGTPMPVSHGLGVWTGAGYAFPGLGSAVYRTSSSSTNLEVYAQDNNKVIVINKSASSTPVTLTVNGISPRSYSAWSTDPTSPTSNPARTVTAAACSNTVRTTLAGYQVLVLTFSC